jgi:hypothetical protein
VAPPGGLVQVEPGIDQRGLLASEPAGGGVVVGDGVDGALHALQAAESDLVAQGIGEALGGPRAVDDVAVVMDPGVECAQRERTLLAQDRPGEGTKGAAGDGAGVGLGGWDGGLVGCGRASALAARIDGPELVPGVIEAAERFEALEGELVDLVVDADDSGDVVVALDLELGPLGAAQTGPVAAVDETATGGDVRLGRGPGRGIVGEGVVFHGNLGGGSGPGGAPRRLPRRAGSDYPGLELQYPVTQ